MKKATEKKPMTTAPYAGSKGTSSRGIPKSRTVAAMGEAKKIERRGSGLGTGPVGRRNRSASKKK